MTGASPEPPLCPTCGQPASEALGGPEHDWECRNEACSEFGQPVRADEPPPARRRFGPEHGSLVVKTYREGVAARAGHDLVLDVTRWQATLDPAVGTLELTADPRSLEVREGLRGVKPLTDRDRDEIRRNIDQKVLGGQPIVFRSSAVRMPDGPGPLTVDGELTMAGSTRTVDVQLEVGDDGRVFGTIGLTQSAWGIKPYRGLMGALKVRDDVEIVVEGFGLPLFKEQ
jgi:polyisoprenoid-binding protein YceI